MGKVNISFDHIKDIKSIVELSVVLYADSFFYGLWTEDEVLIKSDNHAISNFKKVLEIWKKNFRIRKVRLMSTVKPYAHLREKDFDKKYFDDYFDGLYDLSKRSKTKKRTDGFLKEEINTLHYIDKSVLSNLKESKLKFKASHISTALANYTYLIDSDLIALATSDKLHICHAKNGKFQFYNQFHCESAEDYLYYLLWVMKHFNLDPASEPLYLGGTITKDSKLHLLIKSYIKKVKHIDKHLKMPSKVSNPKQLYFDLYLCKSCV